MDNDFIGEPMFKTWGRITTLVRDLVEFDLSPQKRKEKQKRLQKLVNKFDQDLKDARTEEGAFLETLERTG